VSLKCPGVTKGEREDKGSEKCLKEKGHDERGKKVVTEATKNRLFFLGEMKKEN